MRKTAAIIGLVGVLFFAGSVYGAGKKGNDVVEVEEVVTAEVEDSVEYELEWPEYSPWEVVTLEGKLKMQGLPLSPTVKVFMKKDELVTISLRAPFVGEVGRLDLTPDKLLVVNKMNKTYVEEDITGHGIIGGKVLSLRDVQDLLLGRFFLPGFDVSTEDLEELVEVFYEDNQFNVIPKGKAEIEGVKYGFAVDREFNPLLLVVMPGEATGRDIEVSAEYKRKLSGYDIVFAYSEGEGMLEMTFEFKAPEWKGQAAKAQELGGKYRRVGLEEFMRKMG